MQTHIIPLKQEHISTASRLLVEAFCSEAFTRLWLNPASRWQKRAFADLVASVLALHLRCRQPYRVALRNGNIAGVLFLTQPSVGPILDGIGSLILRLPRYLRLFTRMAGVWPYRRALIAPSQLKPSFWTVAAVAVSSAHRNQGIGKALIAHAWQLCSQDPKASGLYLFTGDKHNRIHYEHWGFSLVEEREIKGFTSYYLFRPILCRPSPHP